VYLHPIVNSDEVLTVAVDEVSQRAGNFGIDGQQDRDLQNVMTCYFYI
jgi:hypothetical protein